MRRALGEKLSRRRERERVVCARAGRARPRAAVPVTRFGRIFEGKKSLKGSAMLLSRQHCASPFLQLRVGPRVKQNTRCVNRALKKLVPLK